MGDIWEERETVLLFLRERLEVRAQFSFQRRDQVDQVVGLLGIVLGVMVVTALVSNALDWYLEHLATRSDEKDQRINGKIPHRRARYPRPPKELHVPRDSGNDAGAGDAVLAAARRSSPFAPQYPAGVPSGSTQREYPAGVPSRSLALNQ
jgi:hypothetical protein